MLSPFLPEQNKAACTYIPQSPKRGVWQAAHIHKTRQGLCHSITLGYCWGLKVKLHDSMTSALHKRKRLDEIAVADGFIEERDLGQKVLGC